MTKQMLRLGGGAFALTFTLAFAVSVLDAAPNVARAEAVVQPLLADMPAVAVATVRAPAPVSVTMELKVEPAPVVVDSELELGLAPSLDEPGPWSPPSWFPEAAREELWSLDGISGEAADLRGPQIRSLAAFVYDVDAGRVLLAKNADDRRPVASLTKVVSGLSAMAEGVDMSREVCIETAQWPGWPGAHSYLNTGTCLQGWDLVGAALVASDNRAAFAMVPLTGLPFAPFVNRMNDVAADLGMSMSSFVDPAGVDDDNLSTARDMTRAVLSASLHPVLGPVASAPSWDIHETRREHQRRLFSTNRMAGTGNLEFLAAKTGYTDTARYCFTTVVRTASGRRIAMTILGAPNNRTRWADVRRIMDWADGVA